MWLESTLKRMQTVCMTNCRWQTVPHNWPGHRESAVTKFLTRTRNRVVGTSRWAESIPRWIITAARVHRTGRVVWAPVCVDSEFLGNGSIHRPYCTENKPNEVLQSSPLVLMQKFLQTGRPSCHPTNSVKVFMPSLSKNFKNINPSTIFG